MVFYFQAMKNRLFTAQCCRLANEAKKVGALTFERPEPPFPSESQLSGVRFDVDPEVQPVVTRRDTTKPYTKDNYIWITREEYFQLWIKNY